MIKNPILREKNYKYQRNVASDEIAIEDRIELLFSIIYVRVFYYKIRLY